MRVKIRILFFLAGSILIQNSCSLCRDRLQWVCKQDKLWVCLESVSFNHDPTCNGCDAINIRKNSREDVHVPEWENGKSYPAAYIGDRYVTIKAIFSAAPGVQTAVIRAVTKKGDFGDLGEERVYFKDNGKSCPVYFNIPAKTPDEIKAFKQWWKWYYRDINGTGSDEISMVCSKHLIYILLAEPQSPWTTAGQSEPWADVLEYSCKWAKGETTPEGAAEKITKKFYNDIGAIYDLNKKSYYTDRMSDDLILKNFMDTLRHRNVKYVNCEDMGKSLVTFSNALGCCLLYKESHASRGAYDTKRILLVGRSKEFGWYFGYHAFGCTIFDRVFDATLKVCNPKPEWMINKPWERYKNELISDTSTGSAGTPHPYTFRICIIPKLKSNDSSDKGFISFEKDSYSEFQKGTATLIPGINIDSKILEGVVPGIKKMKKAWDRDIYSIEKIEDNTFSIIRKCWESGPDQLYITMVVGTGIDAVKEYFGLNNAELSSQPNSIEKLNIGDVCSGFKENRDDRFFSGIDFIRNNVLIMMIAEGSIKEKLPAAAVEIDKHLLAIKRKKMLTESLTEEKINIIDFHSKKYRIDQGESVRLYLELVKPEEVYHLWELSGGGIEKDGDNFVYYGGDSGTHKITLYVIDDTGAYDSDSLEIEVKRKCN